MSKNKEHFYIGTTRFTNDTFKENHQWREKHNWDGCIYGLNKKIASSVQPRALIYVIEMNNDTNKIAGIGLVRNYFDSANRFRIYLSDPNYNRYVYNSRYRKDITDILKSDDACSINSGMSVKLIIQQLEKVLFTGKGHYKRGQGITMLKWQRFDSKTRFLLKTFFQNLFELD